MPSTQRWILAVAVAVSAAGGILIGTVLQPADARERGAKAHVKAGDDGRDGGNAARPLVVERVVVREPRDAPAVEPEPDTAEEPADPPEPPPRTAGDIAATFEEAFQSDAPADAKTAVLERQVHAAFALPSAGGARLRTSECRATRCRLEVEFESQEADRAGMIKIMRTEPFLSMGAVVPIRETNDDGSVVATVHLFPSERGPDEELN